MVEDAKYTFRYKNNNDGGGHNCTTRDMFQQFSSAGPPFQNKTQQTILKHVAIGDYYRNLATYFMDTVSGIFNFYPNVLVIYLEWKSSFSPSAVCFIFIKNKKENQNYCDGFWLQNAAPVDSETW